jgi:hypothetical protein
MSSSLILNRTMPFYYFVLVQDTNSKLINVYHKTKDLIFARHQNQSFNFKYNACQEWKRR